MPLFQEGMVKDNVLIQLTEAQQKAVEAPSDGPSLILAAAGSGKTLVLCHRILHFVSKQGVAAKDILAVTFSRQAGQDLLQRLKMLGTSLPSAADAPMLLEGIRVCTFHSFCLSILRAFPSQAGLAPDFVIFTPKMQLHLLEELLKRWYENKNTQKYPAKSSFTVPFEIHERRMFRAEAYRLHRQLRQLQKLRESGCFLENQRVIIDRNNGLFEWVYDKYCLWLKNISGIDFHDFPRLAIKVLESCPYALSAMGLQAHYILVDEFQDTDADQFKLLRLLCRDHQRLTIVGDDDQQIYSWRGATGFYNLSMFENFFTTARIFKLEQNFRSTGAIVAAARSVIAKNVNRVQKTIRTASPTGMILSVCECRNEQCEAAAVEEFILSINKKGIPFEDIAVLYRLQHVGFELQQNLRARGIPCIIKANGSATGDGYLVGSTAKNGKAVDTMGAVLHDILAVLRLVVCEADDLACKQIMEAFHLSLSSSVVSLCVQHLQLHHGTPLLQALKSTRSHLLGLKRHENLSFCREKEELCQADEQEIESVHSILKTLETVKEDLKKLGIRDVIMNLLQQIGPLREKRKSYYPNREPSKESKDFNASPSELESLSHHNIEFAGIKALLKDATQFDKERVAERQEMFNEGVKANSYKELMQQRRCRKSLFTSYESLQKGFDRVENERTKHVQAFLDRVFLKLYDGELVEYGENTSLNSECSTRTGPFGTVSLSTIHQAKGLEWMAVILVRANEGVLPLMDSDSIETVVPQTIDRGFVRKSQSAMDDIKTADDNPINVDSRTDGIVAGLRLPCMDLVPTDLLLLRELHSRGAANVSRNPTLDVLEEERRLMYVALTRAKKYFFITHVMLHNGQQMSPSRFLTDIPRGLMHRTACYESSSPKLRMQTSQQVSRSEDNAVSFSPALQNTAPDCPKTLRMQTSQQVSRSEDKGVSFSPTLRSTSPECTRTASYSPQLNYSKENKLLENFHYKSRDKRKRRTRSHKLNSNCVDLTEGLKDIDDILDAVMEPVVATKDSRVIEKAILHKNGINRAKSGQIAGINNAEMLQAEQNHKILYNQNATLVGNPGDDSDFEEPVSRGRTKNKKYTVSSPDR